MEPLASRLRPTKATDFVGQKEIMGSGMPLRVAMQKKELFSFILWGPPGSGKTTLARIYAREVGAELFELSAVDAGKDDIRKIMATASTMLSLGRPRALFIDEIHRFTKAQQDYLLPFVERGDVVFIGATTENPSFEVIAPLLSRCRVFVLSPHSDDDLRRIIKRTGIKVPSAAQNWLIQYAQGDARLLLSTLETTHRLYDTVTLQSLKDTVQTATIQYNKKGDAHYDTISAFIKSMRAGQGDAAIYYLARMIAAGEDPLFIARRMVIFASEDVGLAQPTALVVANAVFDAVRSIGYPEAAINLAHGVAYLSACKKDRRSYDALRAAQEDVQNYGNLPIPLRIRNAPTKFMKELEYGKDYEMYGNESNLPDKLKKRKYIR